MGKGNTRKIPAAIDCTPTDYDTHTSETVDIPTNVFQDANISFAAQGVYATLYVIVSKGSDSPITDLYKAKDYTKKEVDSLLKELTDSGYVFID